MAPSGWIPGVVHRATCRDSVAVQLPFRLPLSWHGTRPYRPREPPRLMLAASRGWPRTRGVGFSVRWGRCGRETDCNAAISWQGRGARLGGDSGIGCGEIRWTATHGPAPHNPVLHIWRSSDRAARDRPGWSMRRKSGTWTEMAPRSARSLTRRLRGSAPVSAAAAARTAATVRPTAIVGATTRNTDAAAAANTAAAV